MSHPENPTNQLESLIQAKLAEWHHAPVYLASSSAYRKQTLLDSGFAQVASAGVPEEVERKVEGMAYNPFDKYDFKATERIARAKVEYLLAQCQIPDDAMVIAADTVPTIYRIRKDYDVNKTAFEKQILHKPESEDAAKEAILQMLTATVQGWVRVNHKVTAQLQDKSNKYTAQEIFDAYALGFLPLRVKVTTGVAVRLPGQNEIKTFNASADIVIQAAINIAQKYQDQLSQLDTNYPDPDLFPEGLIEELNLLVKKIIEETETSGINPTKVAGGINWADPKIFRLLMAQEINTMVLGSDQLEMGVYLGLPARALEYFLRQQALEIEK